VSYSFFGVQVAFKREERDPLRGQLHHLLARDAGARQSVTAKQRFWKRLSALLATATFEYGDWDLVRGGRAQELFNEWAREIEESAATEPENAGTPSSSYVLATAMVLGSRFERGRDAGERVRHSRVRLADPSDLRAAGLDLPAAELRERPGRRFFRGPGP